MAPDAARCVRIAVGGIAVLTAMAACTSTAPTAPVKRATFAYTCCAAADTERVWHAGDVLTIHWLVQQGVPTELARPNEVELSTGLSGPSADIAGLKHAAISARPRSWQPRL